ncbi:GLE1-domain-containing protein [Rhizoclosmatium globosum]|uniref:mRNA export factor GLE1 n=1 Tax=Rhizoclosmatium globosum TaxID=329046 RepID=A0A1Y2C8D4_9FUNG|nr:GLE1-domain-containing protein [Rhizoclosmatium globosum]|eukprot:ORY43292.1 GLE1-domain-containing protein [Rhizoclosmatium globosum]
MRISCEDEVEVEIPTNCRGRHTPGDKDKRATLQFQRAVRRAATTVAHEGLAVDLRRFSELQIDAPRFAAAPPAFAAPTRVMSEGAKAEGAREKEREKEKEELAKRAQLLNDNLLSFLDKKLNQLKLEAETKQKQTEAQRAKLQLEKEAKEKEERDRKEKEAKEKEDKLKKADEEKQRQQQAQQAAASAAAAPSVPATLPVPATITQIPPTPAPIQTAAQPQPPPAPKRESTVPKGVITSEEAWDSAARFFGVIQNIKANVKPAVVNNPAFSASRMQRMKINQAVGQITRSKQKMMDVARVIHGFLSTAQQKDASYYQYLLDVTAKSFVLQADTEVSVHAIKAPALAQVASMLIEKHPDLLAVLLGRLMKRCPYTVPMYFKRLEGESEDEFLKRCRYKQMEEGVWESEERYNERMCGMIRFYAGLTQIKTNSGMYDIDFGWQWMARVLNINPRKITPQLVCSFLEIAGNSIMKTYKRQAEKLFVYLYKVFLPKMMTLSVPSAMKLQLFLEEPGNFIQTGKMPVLKGSEFEN